MRILVVDDSRTVRELHRRALESAGYQVTTAEDGLDALSCLAVDGSISLVVTDLEMDVMDGVALIQAIRTRIPRPVPIVVVTSQAEAHHRTRVADAGGNAFIVKRGLSWRVLLRTVVKLLGEPGPEPELRMAV